MNSMPSSLHPPTAHRSPYHLPQPHDRPDGNKKAYVRLPSDVEAMEVANKIGFI